MIEYIYKHKHKQIIIFISYAYIPKDNKIINKRKKLLIA